MKKVWILAAVGALAFAGCGPNPVDNSISYTELNCSPGYNCTTIRTRQTVEEQLEDLQWHRQVTDEQIADLMVRMSKVAPTPKPASYNRLLFGKYSYSINGGQTWQSYPKN